MVSKKKVALYAAGGAVALALAGTAFWYSQFGGDNFLVFDEFEEVPALPDVAGDAQRATPDAYIDGSAWVDQMMKYRGAPYTWGGAISKEKGLDCSGLGYRAARDLGATIPRVSRMQCKAMLDSGTKMSEEVAKNTKGACVWFSKRNKSVTWNNVFHIAYSLGDGRMIEAQCHESACCTTGNPCKGGVVISKWGWWKGKGYGEFFGTLPHIKT